MIQTACRWGALILLDEADVMIADRTTNELSQNALTVVLLRILEYSEGIIFLTSNMDTKLDRAVMDRCPINIRYDDLDSETKIQVLDRHLKRYDPSCDPDSIPLEQKREFVDDCRSGRQVSLQGPPRRPSLMVISDFPHCAHSSAIGLNRQGRS